MAKGWKTVVFGVLLALVSALSNEEMKQFLVENVEWIGSSIGTIVVVLRALTNSSIFSKE
jgi:hypothetical protein